MCGRWVLVLRPSDLRQRLERDGLRVHACPPDPDKNRNFEDGADSKTYSATAVRPSYNIAPTYIEPIYRAVVDSSTSTTRYELTPARWGLIPVWNVKSSEASNFTATMKTINCRDDALTQNRGIWNSVKHTKRCIIPAQGFYEWLTKGNNKQPYYIKPKASDGLFYFAGLWEFAAGVYTFTIITTSSNSQLRFLHDRMPVIFRDADAIRAWLDPTMTQWGPLLQNMLQPLDGEEIDVYPVAKEVGKVGRSESWFIRPLEERKGSIESFFAKHAGIKRERDAVEEEEDKQSVIVEDKTQGENDGSHRRKTIRLEDSAYTSSAARDHESSTIQKGTGNTMPQTQRTPNKQRPKAPTPSPRKQDKLAKDKGNAKITSFFTTQS